MLRISLLTILAMGCSSVLAVENAAIVSLGLSRSSDVPEFVKDQVSIDVKGKLRSKHYLTSISLGQSSDDMTSAVVVVDDKGSLRSIHAPLNGKLALETDVILRPGPLNKVYVVATGSQSMLAYLGSDQTIVAGDRARPGFRLSDLDVYEGRLLGVTKSEASRRRWSNLLAPESFFVGNIIELNEKSQGVSKLWSGLDHFGVAKRDLTTTARGLELDGLSGVRISESGVLLRVDHLPGFILYSHDMKTERWRIDLRRLDEKTDLPLAAFVRKGLVYIVHRGEESTYLTLLRPEGERIDVRSTTKLSDAAWISAHVEVDGRGALFISFQDEGAHAHGWIEFTDALVKTGELLVTQKLRDKARNSLVLSEAMAREIENGFRSSR